MPHRVNRCPGQRFRFEQYISYLHKKGYDTSISNLLTEQDDELFYKKGNYIAKFIILINSFIKRFADFFSMFKYDIVFIYREAIMVGTSFFERLYSITPAKIIYDFDDSIWLNDTSDGNSNLSWMKNPSKTKRICKLADKVIVGNDYLAQYALQYNNNVEVIPTTIDLNYHNRKNVDYNKKSICIGWTGTSTTLKHFQKIEPILEQLKEDFGDRISFKLICDTDYKNDNLNLRSTKWNVRTEIKDLSDIDIGIMPLPNDEWSKGKCGFKGLQYMALGIPTIMSPVGVNNEIITDGKNGYLAKDNIDWHTKISCLITSAELRSRLGQNGHKTVKERYSVEAFKEQYLKIFNDLIS